MAGTTMVMLVPADCAAGWASVHAARSSGGHDGVTVVQSITQVHIKGRHGINPHGGAADLHGYPDVHGCHNSSTTMTARTVKACTTQ